MCVKYIFALDKALFEERKNALLLEEAEVHDAIRLLEAGNDKTLKRMEEFLELIRNAPFTYKNANPDEKRDLLRNLISNLQLIDRNVSVEPRPEVYVLVNRPKFLYSAPSRGITRTWNELLKALLKQFSAVPEPSANTD